MRVYHIPLSSSRVVAWSYEHRYGPGDVLVDPPDVVAERYGQHFDRLDDGEGGVPTSELEQMPRSILRRVAAASDADIDGNSSTEDIIDAVGSDREPVDAAEDRTIDDSRETTAEALDGRDRSEGSSQEDVDAEMREILDEHPDLAEEELETDEE